MTLSQTIEKLKELEPKIYSPNGWAVDTRTINGNFPIRDAGLTLAMVSIEAYANFIAAAPEMMRVILRQQEMIEGLREALERIRKTGFKSVVDDAPHRIAAKALTDFDPATKEV